MFQEPKTRTGTTTQSFNNNKNENNIAASSFHREVHDQDNDEDDEDMWLNLSRHHHSNNQSTIETHRGGASNANVTMATTSCTSTTNIESVQNPRDDLYQQLYEMEQSVRCNICRNIYHAPVSIIPCHHTYCSRCIRQHWKSEIKNIMKRGVASCPECRVTVDTKGKTEFEKCLIINRSYEITIQHYRKLRKLLYHTLALSSQNRIATTDRQSPTNMNINASLDACDDDDDDTTFENDNKKVNGNPRRIIPKNNMDEMNRSNPKSSSNIIASSAQISAKPFKSINTDSSENCAITAATPTNNMKYKKAELYSMMKKSKLQEICRRDGLPTYGTEQDLIQRHAAFVTLYNSECDSLYPKSYDEMINDVINKEHHVIKSLNDDYANMKKSISSSSSKMMNDKFRSMIESLKSKQKVGKKNDDEGGRNVNGDVAAQHNETNIELRGGSTTITTNTDSSNGKTQIAAEGRGTNHYASPNDSIKQQNSCGYWDKDAENNVELKTATTPRIGSTNPIKNCVTSSLKDSYSYVDNSNNRSAEINKNIPYAKKQRERYSKSSYSGTRVVYDVDDNEPDHKVLMDRYNHSSRNNDGHQNMITSSSMTRSSAWDCPECTFRNEKHKSLRSVCEMCGTCRPLSTAKTR